VPGATTSRASKSASMTGTPQSRNRAATALFPDAMPPVSPNRCTTRFCATNGAVASAKISRRKLLAGVGSVLVGASAIVAFFRTRGYVLPADVAGRLVALEPWEYIFVQHAARRVCAADRDDASIPTADETKVADFADAYIAQLPDDLKSDLKKLLLLVEHLWPLANGFSSRFSELGPADQDRVLSSLEASDESLLRGGFAGLKSLLFMGYYRDPRTWRMLGYAGPRLDRPVGGW
jgi:hypothetical protein